MTTMLGLFPEAGAGDCAYAPAVRTHNASPNAGARDLNLGFGIIVLDGGGTWVEAVCWLAGRWPRIAGRA